MRGQAKRQLIRQAGPINNNRGSVLIISLITSFLLIVFSSALLSMVTSEAQHTLRSVRAVQAINIAEAGIEEALWQLNYNNSEFAAADGWTGNDPVTKTAPFVDGNNNTVGVYEVTASEFSTSTPVIESTAYIPDQSTPLASRTVRVLLEPAAGFAFQMAAFAQQNITFNSNGCTDSYDSRQGEYSADNIGSNGDVGTNKTGANVVVATLNSNASINGDLFVGPGSDIDNAIIFNANSEVTGTVTTLPQTVDLPDIEPPTGLPVMPSINLDDDNTITINSSGEYQNINLNSNSKMYITADATIYVKDYFNLNSNSEIIVQNNAKVKIYFDDGFSANSNTVINNQSKNPTNFTILATNVNSSPVFNFNSNSNIYGSIYGKQIDFNSNSNAELFGALVVNSLNMNSNACIHYDEALADEAITQGDGYAVSLWQEK